LETEVPNDIVDKVNYSQNQLVIDRLTKIVNTLRNGGLILAIILAAVAFLVAFNTIRLAIYSNRESVEIMRLVGASNSLIRGPYIVEGVIHGLIAAIITMIIFIPLVQVLSPYIQVLVPEFSITSYFWHNFLPLLGIQCLIGILLGIFSSFIAIRKYLKV
jgi:cell division transport system permease protein